MKRVTGRNHTSSYNWLIDRLARNDDKVDDIVNIRQEGLEFRLERQSYNNYACIELGYVETEQPFTIAPQDTSNGCSERALGFLVALTGRADGLLPNGQRFMVDKDWGVLSDFYDGTAQIDVSPDEPLRTFSADIPFSQVVQLFKDDGYPVDIDDFINHKDLLKSYRMRPAMVQIANNAVNCSLTGTLRRLFLEGAALQLFALILSQQTLEPIVGEKMLTQVVANKQAVIEAAEYLLADLEKPPTMIELSVKSGLSARKLSAGAKEIYGCSMFELLARKRLEAAKQALEIDPNISIKALAYNVGYSHQSNFISAFKKQFGLTPRQYTKAFYK